MDLVLNYADFMAVNHELLSSLRSIGLNQYEAKAYLSLASFGGHTAGELSERAELPRPRVYDVLSRLQDKGFVTIQQGRPVKYAAIPIGEATKTFKKHRQGELNEELSRIDEVGAQFAFKLKPSKAPQPGAEENVWTLKGRDMIYSKMASMLASAKSEVFLASPPESVLRKFDVHRKDFLKARQRGAQVNFVSPSVSPEITKIANNVVSASVPTRVLLADDQALVFLSDHGVKPEDETGVWLRSPHFVKTMKQALK